MVWMCFFFSSRRRHTRWTGDWSSDVCSSDLDGVGQRLFQQRDQRHERPRRLLLVSGQQLMAEFRQDWCRVVLRRAPLWSGQAHAVVLDNEPVQSLKRSALLGQLVLEALGGGADRFVEERQQQLVLAGEVLVEAAQRLPGAVYDLLDGEVTARLGAGQELEAGVEEALHPAFAPDASRVEGSCDCHVPPPHRGVWRGCACIFSRGHRLSVSGYP